MVRDDQRLQELLDAGQTGELLEASMDRLRRLARKMLGGWPGLRRWEQTDDVLQNSLLRLHRALSEGKPATTAAFLGLAARQIRWELLDLSKHHFGPQGAAANHHTDGHGQAADDPGEPLEGASLDGEEPGDLEGWTRFHEAVEGLSEEERAVVGLLYYQGLTQQEASAALDIPLRTLKRRWLSARLRLQQRVQEPPS